jgi:hypothetical protein
VANHEDAIALLTADHKAVKGPFGELARPENSLLIGALVVVIAGVMSR